MSGMTTKKRKKGRKYCIYISGPMRGREFYNFPLFDKVAKALRKKCPELEVINPADLDRELGFDPMKRKWDTYHDWSHVVDDFDLQKCIDRDIKALRRCDLILMLPGWESSIGASAEVAYMRWRQKQVLYFQGFSEDGGVLIA